jgi:hypothetical protein
MRWSQSSYSFSLLSLISPAFTSALPDFQPPQKPLGSVDIGNASTSAGTLRYAAFGDSWTTGVSWGAPNEEVEVDFPDQEEICRCRRTTESYPYQLLVDEDRGWIGGRSLDVDFVACHGAWFQDISGQVASLKDGPAPDVATLMVGGNPGGFPEIVEDCLYLFNSGKNYGPEYPDPTGACFQTLARAHATLHSPGFAKDLVMSINTILAEPRIFRNPNFRLYVLSYSGLFNHDDESCNDWSFGIWPGKRPRLTTELRQAINKVIDDGRVLYDLVINRLMFNPKVRYIDINDAFHGHRFCEPTAAGTYEAQVENSWLYAFAWPDCIPLEARAQILDDGIQVDRWPSICRQCGGLGELGEIQRILHPNAAGHTAIKAAVKELFQKEHIAKNVD